MENKKLSKYKNYKTDVYNIGGPGGFWLAEFMAEKMSIKKDKKLIDIGFCQGFQTCFLAKEYDVNIVGIDPGGELSDIPYGIEPLMDQARKLGVEDKILGIKACVPDSLLPCNYFDYAYTTNCLEMIRGWDGAAGYLAALKEIHRILKKNGILGLAEPMCHDVPIPNKIAEIYEENGFDKCFVTVEETRKAVKEAGFKVIEYGYLGEAYELWQDSVAELDSDDEYRKAIEQMNNSGWLSFGYVIAIKE